MISLYLNILSALPDVGWTNSWICKNFVTNYWCRITSL